MTTPPLTASVVSSSWVVMEEGWLFTFTVCWTCAGRKVTRTSRTITHRTVTSALASANALALNDYVVVSWHAGQESEILRG